MRSILLVLAVVVDAAAVALSSMLLLRVVHRAGGAARTPHSGCGGPPIGRRWRRVTRGGAGSGAPRPSPTMLLLLLLLLMLLHAVQAEHSPDGQAHLTDHSLTCGQHQFSHAALVSVLGCSGAAAASCARIESILYTFVDFACYLWHAVNRVRGCTA